MREVFTTDGAQARREAAPAGTVIQAGRRLVLDGDGLTIGRRSENDVVIERERVSRHHARIAPSDGAWYVADLDSMNGTYLNGERLRGESRWLASGDTISVGGEALRYVAGERTHAGVAGMPLVRAQVVQYAGGRLAIGRDPSNDVVLDDPNVSRFHAELVPAGGGGGGGAHASAHGPPGNSRVLG